MSKKSAAFFSSEITLSEAMRFDCFSGASIIAGKSGMNRNVKLVNVMEVPDISNWVSENELILTTGYPFKDKPEEMETLIADLNEKNVCGIAFKLSRFIKTIPENVIHLADELGFPIISLPHYAQFDQIILDFFSHVIDYSSGGHPKEMLSAQIQKLALSGGNIQEVSSLLANWFRGEVVIKNAYGAVLAQNNVDLFDDVSISYERQIVYDGNVHAIIVIRVSGDRDIKDDLLEIDNSIPAIIMILFQSSYRGMIQKREHILNDLLLGRGAISNKKIEQVSYLGVDFNKSCIVCILKTNKSEQSEFDIVQSCLSDILYEHGVAKSVLPVVTKFQNRLIHLYFSNHIDPSDIKKTYEELVIRIKTQIPDIIVKIGISSVGDNALKIREQYQEAQRIIDLALHDNQEDSVLLFDDLNIDAVLSGIQLDTVRKNFIYKEIGSLIKYDDENNKSLLKTLETLVSEESDADAAKRLFIHPKTMAYRKNKIEQILDKKITRKNQNKLFLAVKLFRLNESDYYEK